MVKERSYEFYSRKIDQAERLTDELNNKYNALEISHTLSKSDSERSRYEAKMKNMETRRDRVVKILDGLYDSGIELAEGDQKRVLKLKKRIDSLLDDEDWSLHPGSPRRINLHHRLSKLYEGLNKYGGSWSYSCLLIVGLFLVSFSITGHSIASLSSLASASVGGVFLILGLIGVLFFFIKRNK